MCNATDYAQMCHILVFVVNYFESETNKKNLPIQHPQHYVSVPQFN